MASMIAEASIGQAFAQGQSLYRAIDEGNAPPDEQNKFTFDAIGCFEQVNTSIASLSLISSNETASDVNTGDLKYVLADFYLAELHLKIGEMASRERNLEIAAGCYFRFLSRCEQLQLMSESDLKTWKDQEEGNQPDPGTLREQKISAFKRERALKQRLQQLAARAAAAAGGAGGGGGGNDEQEEEEEEEEEEVAREALLVTLELGVARSLAELRAVEEERRLLARFAPQARAAAAAHHGREQDDPRLRPRADDPDDPGRPGLRVTRLSRDARSGRVLAQRETVKAGVFRPTVAPPTVTLEEFAAQEVAAARARQAAQAAAQAGDQPDRRIEHLERDGDEDDADLAERATYKDRAWDNWKDENPRGAGNKANKLY